MFEDAVELIFSEMIHSNQDKWDDYFRVTTIVSLWDHFNLTLPNIVIAQFEKYIGPILQTKKDAMMDVSISSIFFFYLLKFIYFIFYRKSCGIPK